MKTENYNLLTVGVLYASFQTQNHLTNINEGIHKTRSKVLSNEGDQQ